jgi:hypothetical protein
MFGISANIFTNSGGYFSIPGADRVDKKLTDSVKYKMIAAKVEFVTCFRGLRFGGLLIKE